MELQFTVYELQSWGFHGGEKGDDIGEEIWITDAQKKNKKVNL